MPLVVVNAYPNASVFTQKFPQKLKPRIHHGQPLRMLQIIVVVLKGAFRVVRRVYVNALHLARVIGQQRLEGFQIIALNEHVLRGTVAVAPGFLQQTERRASGLSILFTTIISL